MDHQPKPQPTSDALKIMPGPGTFTVSLSMDVQADSPADAVEGFLEGINTFGLRSHVYSVRSEDATLLYVSSGTVMTPDELDTLIEAPASKRKPRAS